MLNSNVDAWRKICRRGAVDPVWWIQKILGIRLHRRQRDITEAVKVHDRVAVKSGHGVGKSTVSACIAIWWVVVKQGLVLVTAPTWAQVIDVWFTELHRRLRSAVIPASSTDATRPRLDRWMIRPGWGIIGVNSNDPNNVHGYHAPRILLIADEAFGVDDRLFEVFHGSQTGRGVGEAKTLLLGNPTDMSTYAGRAFTPQSTWAQFTLSCYDSPNVTGEFTCPGLATKQWIEDSKLEYGENSSAYRIRVLGEFPLAGAIDRVIPEFVLQDSIGRVPEQMILGKIYKQPRHSVVQGVDVARFGDDETVSAIIRDGVVIDVQARSGMGTVEVAAWARARAETFGCVMTVVDETGVGGGVVDELRRMKVRVEGINYASKSNDSKTWGNIRDEMAFVLAKAMEKGHLGLPADVDPELVEELREQRYWVDSQGRLRLEAKEECKKRIGKSPDRADAVKQAWHGFVHYRAQTSEEVGRSAVVEGWQKLMGRANTRGGSW